LGRSGFGGSSADRLRLKGLAGVGIGFTVSFRHKGLQLARGCSVDNACLRRLDGLDDWSLLGGVFFALERFLFFGFDALHDTIMRMSVMFLKLGRFLFDFDALHDAVVERSI
jgi:hypothetical protein